MSLLKPISLLMDDCSTGGAFPEASGCKASVFILFHVSCLPPSVVTVKLLKVKIVLLWAEVILM